MELLPLVCLCLLSCSGDAVRVEEGIDAVLPCSLTTVGSLAGKRFDWKKDGQKVVFMYDAGIHSNNGRPGQDWQFKGRVSHFQDQLRNGNASIEIRNMKVPDSGNYSCDFPRLQPRQTFYIELVVDPGVKVVVEEDSDAVLNCSLSTKEDISGKVFDWKKDEQEVFFYDSGIHYNNGRPGQDEQFKGRVSFFEHQLQNGNASIEIRNTKMADSGIYSCIFPRLQPRQTFYIELVVDQVLRDRTGENIRGAASKPSVTVVKTDDGMVLQCEVRRASPKPEVEWKDSSGNILQAEEPKVTERGGSYDIVLRAAVTKTDTFRCVVTQEGIKHQTHAETYVPLDVPPPESAVRVVVEEDSDAVLPCLISNKEDISGKRFDWRKDGQKEVFMYDAGIHSNNGRPGQDEQFKGRVSHFQDQLRNGNASIKITNTKMADSGIYSCIFPRLQPRQTFIIELVVDPAVRVVVEEDSDVVLPCLISTKQDITGKFFDWKKDGVEDVFMHYSDGRTNQGPQFIDRVSHFEDQLQNGDASIKIRKTKMADSGNYSCIFPHLQTFDIELVVGLAPRPNIKILAVTKDGVLLQCEARGDPPPTVEWKDSDGNTLPAEESQISERGGLSYITVNITVTKTDNYRCVATQKEYSHQIFAETSVYIQGSNTGAIVAGVVVILLVVVVVLAVLHFMGCITLSCKKGSTPASANGPTETELALMKEKKSGQL